ncbi:MAG: hypothetical protein MJE12_13065 [Alphaproteobacteria bacterium]|nr:hypothetical protein [Alphaproteobacteria bacterium]
MAISVRAYTLPLRIRYVWAKGAHDTRRGVIVRAALDGAVGWGEVAFGPHVEIDGAGLEAEVTALLEGLDAQSEDFLDALDARHPHNRIRCGIATAWLSARAAAAGQPLNRYLAPDREPTTAIPINGLINATDAAGVVDQAHAYAAQGMTTFKTKCFADVERDIERVRALREAFPDAAIRLDPNDAWKTPNEALHNLERFAPFEIDYVEDPLDTHRATLPAMADVRARSPIKVAWDNPVEDIDAMLRLLDADAVDVFVFKMPRAGGPDRQRAMLDLAAGADRRAVMTAPLESAVGTMAGLHLASLTAPPLPACGFSLSAHLARDIATLPDIVDGTQIVPDTPGLGTDPSPFWSET